MPGTAPRASSHDVLRASMVEDVAGSGADISTEAELQLLAHDDHRPIPVSLRHTSVTPMGFNVHASFTHGSFYAFNFLFPFVYHYLRVSPAGAPSRLEKHYTFTRAGSEHAESSFALQLRSFAKSVRRRQQERGDDHVEMSPPVGPAVGPQSAVRNMELLDEIYVAAGLGLRGTV